MSGRSAANAPAALPETRPPLPPPLERDVSARLAQESRDLLVAKGLSPEYVDAHFTLLEAPDGGRLTVTWRFSVGEYETAVRNGLGYDTVNGERHYRHGLEYWPATAEILSPLPRADAETLLYDCMGQSVSTRVTYDAPLSTDGSREPAARLSLTGRTAPDAAYRVTFGTLDLETGVCAVDTVTVRPLPDHNRGGVPLPGPPTPVPLFAPAIEAKLDPRLLAQLRALSRPGRAAQDVPVAVWVAVPPDDAPLATRPQIAGPITAEAVEALRAAWRRYDAARVDAAVASVADRLRARGFSPSTTAGSNEVRVNLPATAIPYAANWGEVIRLGFAEPGGA